MGSKVYTITMTPINGKNAQGGRQKVYTHNRILLKSNVKRLEIKPDRQEEKENHVAGLFHSKMIMFALPAVRNQWAVECFHYFTYEFPVTLFNVLSLQAQNCPNVTTQNNSCRYHVYSCMVRHTHTRKLCFSLRTNHASNLIPSWQTICEWKCHDGT